MFDKIKEGANLVYEKSQELKNQSIKLGKKYIRKKALENIKEKLEFAQKSETEFTKEQMRRMIEIEEKKIIKNLKEKSAITALLAMLGISNF